MFYVLGWSSLEKGKCGEKGGGEMPNMAEMSEETVRLLGVVGPLGPEEDGATPRVLPEQVWSGARSAYCGAVSLRLLFETERSGWTDLDREGPEPHPTGSVQ